MLAPSTTYRPIRAVVDDRSICDPERRARAELILPYPGDELPRPDDLPCRGVHGVQLSLLRPEIEEVLPLAICQDTSSEHRRSVHVPEGRDQPLLFELGDVADAEKPLMRILPGPLQVESDRRPADLLFRRNRGGRRGTGRQGHCQCSGSCGRKDDSPLAISPASRVGCPRREIGRRSSRHCDPLSDGANLLVKVPPGHRSRAGA